MSDEIKDLQKGITDILVAIGKIETQITQLSNMSSKLAETERTVIQLEQSTKSAHKRLDEMEQDKRDAKEDRKWLWGALLGAAAFIWKIVDSFKGVGL